MRKGHAPPTSRLGGARPPRAYVWARNSLLIGLAVAALTQTNWPILAGYLDRLVSGLLVTLTLTACAIIGGALIALPLAIWHLFGGKRVAVGLFCYSYAVRGTPLLLQLFLIYYGAGDLRPLLEEIGVWWLFRDPFFAAAIVFVINSSAYQFEIYRGAIAAVPKGQWEGAASLGLRKTIAFRKIILPQAARLSLRPFGNELIFAVKGSAIASVITVYDLMGQTRLIFSRTYDFEVYFYAATAYLVIVETVRQIWDRIERRLSSPY